MITPTAIRTLTIPADASLQNSVPLMYPNAFPASSLDYWLDVTNVAAYTDSVVSFTFGPSNPAGLTITPIQLNLISENFLIGAFIGGGVEVTQYVIPVTVTFASGEVFATNVFLTIGQVSGCFPTGYGSVQSVAIATDGNILETGSPITTSGTISLSLSTTGVTAGTYTSANIVVDAYGRIISISNGTGGGGGGGGTQSFIVLESDGVSQILLEDSSGSILLESSS